MEGELRCNFLGFRLLRQGHFIQNHGRSWVLVDWDFQEANTCQRATVASVVIGKVVSAGRAQLKLSSQPPSRMPEMESFLTFRSWSTMDQWHNA